MVAELLINHGVDKRILNNEHKMASDLAWREGHGDVVQLLEARVEMMGTHH